MNKKFVLNSERFVDTKVAEILRRELERRTNPERIGKALELLRSRRAFSPVFNNSLKRLEYLLKELPEMITYQSNIRRSSLNHIFSGKARSDPSRHQYFKAIEELKKLVTGPDFPKLIREPGAANVLEQQAQGILNQLAGTVDSYSGLGIETGAFNAIVERLYPIDFPSLRIDAHHIIEDRTFKKFEDTWKLLGWNSPDDMPCIPLSYEFHIRSPKRLHGIEKLGRDLDVSSLTQQLLQAINLNKIKTPEKLLDAYSSYYSRTAIWKDVKPVLKEVERELARRRGATAIVQAKKKL